MAPGTYNGKNYGGLHTGTGQHQHSGVYGRNGYRHKNVSHMEFEPGTTVAYMGNHRNKRYVPSGAQGTVLEKDWNDKTARTMIKVDFDNHGVRHVYKKNLYIQGSIMEDRVNQLEKCEDNVIEKTDRQKQKASEKYQKQLKKSQKARKTYREGRKKLNDQKNIELDVFIKHLQKKYSTMFPVHFLLEKKEFIMSDNEYDKDYKTYIKLKHKTFSVDKGENKKSDYKYQTDWKKTDKGWIRDSEELDEVDAVKPQNIERLLWGLY